MAEYYVRSTGGSDGNNGLSFAQGWATISYAFANSSAFDTIYLCSNTTNPFTTTLALTINSQREFIGCSLIDGAAYNGSDRACIKRSTGSASLIILNNNNNRTLWQDVVFDGNYEAENLIDINADSYIQDYTFRNCEFKQSALSGVEISASSTIVQNHHGINFHHCNFYLNWDCGLYVSYTVTNHCPSIMFYNCSIHDNDSWGVCSDASGTITIVNSRLFSNFGAVGLTYNVLTTTNIYNSVIALSDYSGLHIDTSATMCTYTLLNNIIAHNGTYGVYKGTVMSGPWLSASYNCFFNNPSGNINNINNNEIPGIGNILADPKFISIVDGAEDFRLQSDSPCLDTGKSFRSGY